MSGVVERVYSGKQYRETFLIMEMDIVQREAEASIIASRAFLASTMHDTGVVRLGSTAFERIVDGPDLDIHWTERELLGGSPTLIADNLEGTASSH